MPRVYGPRPWNLRQEDHKFRTSLGYVVGFPGEKKRDDLNDRSWQKECSHRFTIFPVLKTFNKILENKLKRVCFSISAHSNCTKYLIACLFLAFKHYFKEYSWILLCLILENRFRWFIFDRHTAEMTQCTQSQSVLMAVMLWWFFQDASS